jgi:hypothetical protein
MDVRTLYNTALVPHMRAVAYLSMGVQDLRPDQPGSPEGKGLVRVEVTGDAFVVGMWVGWMTDRLDAQVVEVGPVPSP